MIWQEASARVGIRIERSDHVFASYDGKGTLTLCNEDCFDPDDSLAQFIFHELCHALVAGDNALSQQDWGMSNTDARDLPQEHACHRLQAQLADRHGLRALFGVTTDHRPFWDALGAHPMQGSPDDPSIALAARGFERSRRAPWLQPLDEALRASARIADLLRDRAPSGSLWRHTLATPEPLNPPA